MTKSHSRTLVIESIAVSTYVHICDIANEMNVDEPMRFNELPNVRTLNAEIEFLFCFVFLRFLWVFHSTQPQLVLSCLVSFRVLLDSATSNIPLRLNDYKQKRNE